MFTLREGDSGDGLIKWIVLILFGPTDGTAGDVRHFLLGMLIFGIAFIVIELLDLVFL